ncbi:hypothetical protein PR003_g26399 [Phytophthora rubi]|uniref:Uncharacterized protein n=1 Tax=Phytophthora rubi TaxID=129364 RepID=A0A6A4CA10_9STRA|nr:hypothetical protein PR003_g26399 [Phytophthora rubi]
MRDVEEEKKKKKDKKKEKATALQTQGEILRDQAVTRRSERGDAATEASEDSPDTGGRTSGAKKAAYRNAGVNKVSAEFSWDDWCVYGLSEREP